jgi:arylsulfatase A-like enzyme
LRDGKMSTFEGGQRVPCIVWAPGRVPAGTECNALASTIDLLPTIAAITGTPLPADRAIDGLDISPLFFGTAKSVRTEFLYYNMGGRIEGIREGDWKLLSKEPAGKAGPATPQTPDLLLFNLADDLGEKHNVAAEQPEIVQRLRRKMLEQNADIEAEARPVWRKTGG